MIQIITRHIIRNLAMLSVLVMALAFTGCRNDFEPADPSVDEGAGMFLICNVGLLGQTRAGETPAIELMQSLRIVIVNDQGTVESNEYFEFQSLRDSYYHIIPLKSRTKKRVYLFANEESVEVVRCQPATLGLMGTLHDYLDAVIEGTVDFENKINSIYYKPDFTKAIPFNAVYDVEVPAGEKYIKQTFWLVRAATKFSFTFVNNRYQDVTVDRFSISDLSDRHFFMPKFTDNNVPTFEGYDTWIDWLKDVSDKSQVDPDNPSADASGWLTGYDLPTDAQKTALSYSTPFTLNKVPEVGLQGGVKEINNLYACESKKLRTDGEGIVSDEQQYALHVECTSAGEKKTFDVVLPNVRALFRNTHVHVNVNINEKYLVLTVDVQPFSSVNLLPQLGLERTDDGYIVVRDRQGNIIKYIRPNGSVLTFEVDKRWPYLGDFMGVFDSTKRVLVGYFEDGRSIIFNYNSDEYNPADVYEHLESWEIYSKPTLKYDDGKTIPEHLEETFCFKDYANDGTTGGTIRKAYTHIILDDKGRVIEEYLYPSLDDFWDHWNKNDKPHEDCGRIKLADYTGNRYGDKVVKYYDESGNVTCTLTVKGNNETYE